MVVVEYHVHVLGAKTNCRYRMYLVHLFSHDYSQIHVILDHHRLYHSLYQNIFGWLHHINNHLGDV